MPAVAALQPPLTYSWYYGGKPLTERHATSSRLQVFGNQTGIFQCHVTGQHGNMQLIFRVLQAGEAMAEIAFELVIGH